MRIALVSRDEIYPLSGGGIGQFVTAAARLLSQIAEVTIFTTSGLREGYERLRAQGDERLPGDGVRMVFIPAPTAEESADWYQAMQCYSARVLERLREHYGDRGPDLIEFADFLGEGFVTTQAAWALDPFLAHTRVCVRLHTSAEMVEVLDGFWKPDLGARAVHALERFSLAAADRVIWQGGDVLGTYQRFYGRGAIAPPVRIRYPYAGPVAAPEPDFSVAGRPLRLLYAGRLERRKGVVNLVRAATALPRDDFRLTLVGGDTVTGPLATSMRDQLELAVADDGRVRFADGMPRGELAQLIAAHDVVIVPSLWECWPYAALEPLHLNRPVLSTPVGGLVEMVMAGRSGWSTSGTDAVALGDSLDRLLDQPTQVQALVRGAGPLGVARGLCDEQAILDAYEGLARADLVRPVPRRTSRPRTLVSVVIDCADASRTVSDTIASLLAQTHRALEIVLVADRSPAQADAIDRQLAGRLPVVRLGPVSGGPGAARNEGVRRSRGRYVLVLERDVVLAPQLVARCVEILEHRPEVAYVTSWAGAVVALGPPPPDPADQPLGNQAALIAEENVAGDLAAMFRRRLFEQGAGYAEDLAGDENWHLYRELHAAGRHGAVIPERLICAVARPSGNETSHRERVRGEMLARLRENAMTWTCASAEAQTSAANGGGVDAVAVTEG